ncbi:putative phage infection (PIP) family protein YhgE [Evansella vedderi]|uniref:Phage infection (PIP) family protein YhgE n=1 Tax=Evansella vedderi TaxID=38282 RepID=A0ABT9ZTV9_9BACI|nr:DUF2524 family protein [Evansella vedderi]MDQ0253600.1 putative phage infection (PIP) family protein YhgE [Evansella vedderi]
MTNEQVEQYINKIKETINEAQKELAEVKIVRENDPTDYSYLMQQLQQLNEDMGDYLANATPKQREDLLEAREYLHYTQEIMTRGI